ncbi:hypothetical protein RFI_15155 [Reticulomyxa filosa]|uniref:Alpha/beta hydrolase fold-3 domain-containing protein n=1 Tax=Reticulomyxa filosa TaxID=46433 RepID=X6N6Z9_RETFI|nr:hypothetical protein RFI_15155 [Reticulomyxa filosa]|eukprot:ETO22050.1 hypothetical protein RFI_15155 [Reticulomyxa filosa]
MFGARTGLWIFALPMFTYYTLNYHRAAGRANEFLADPDIRIIRLFYDFLDSQFARWVALRIMPRLGIMPALVTAKYVEWDVRDIQPFEWDDFHVLQSQHGSGYLRKKLREKKGTSSTHDHTQADENQDGDEEESGGAEDDDDADDVLNYNDAKNSAPSTSANQTISKVRVLVFSCRQLNIKEQKDFIADTLHQGILPDETEVEVKTVDDKEEKSKPAKNEEQKRNENKDADKDDDEDEEEEEEEEEDGDFNSQDDEYLLMNSSAEGSDVSEEKGNKQTKDKAKQATIHLVDDVPSRNHSSERGLIFFIHGGGFMANFCSSDLSLTPFRWPCALQECCLAYQAVCEGKLGFNVNRIAVVGDSSGGNLAVAMVLKMIQSGRRVPDALILSSPILNLREEPTPSRLLFMMDPLVPMRLIQRCRKMYLQANNDDEHDFLVSPLSAAPDYLLSSFPPTSIVVGGLDPFLDDAVDFAHRLSNVGRDVRLKRYEFAPHAFLNFNYILPDVNHAIHLIADWIDDAFMK